MSEQRINQICDRFIDQIPAACAAGEGERLLLSFLEETAEQWAEVAIFHLATRRPPPTETAAEDYAGRMGIDLIKSIRLTNEENGIPAGELADRIERTVMTAYAGRLFELLSSIADGGEA